MTISRLLGRRSSRQPDALGKSGLTCDQKLLANESGGATDGMAESYVVMSRGREARVSVRRRQGELARGRLALQALLPPRAADAPKLFAAGRAGRREQPASSALPPSATGAG